MSDQGYAVVRNLSQTPTFGGKGPRLPHLDLELTERCNNACVHCFINRPARDREAAARELSTARWQDVLTQAAELGALSIRITGGEPLLRPDFPEIYLFARRLGLQVMLFTNGRLITPELADLFRRVPPLKKVEISVYGMRPESYDALAGARGAFAEFRRGIDLLSASGVPFVVKPVLLSASQHERAEFEAWAGALPGMKIEPAAAIQLDLRGRRDSPAKNRRIARLRLAPEEVAAADGDGNASRREVAQFGARFMGPPGDRLFTCGAGEAGCVDANGRYQMCLLLRHPETVFDLGQGTLREALTEFFPLVRELRATHPAYLTRCARCFLKGLCEQCPAKSWAEHGDLDTPVEYLCEVAHARARRLGLLREGERAWEVDNWRTRLAGLEAA